MERKFKKRYLALALAAVLLIALSFYLFPRKLDSLLIGNHNARNVEISIEIIYDDNTEPTTLTLTHEDMDDLIEELKDTAVRRKMFPKDVFHSPTVLMICAKQNDNIVGHADAYYYTAERILTIDGKQYEFYDDDFIEELEEIYSKFLRENITPA